MSDNEIKCVLCGCERHDARMMIKAKNGNAVCDGCIAEINKRVLDAAIENTRGVTRQKAQLTCPKCNSKLELAAPAYWKQKCLECGHDQTNPVSRAEEVSCTMAFQFCAKCGSGQAHITGPHVRLQCFNYDLEVDACYYTVEMLQSEIRR